jgi:hypothetical protein
LVAQDWLSRPGGSCVAFQLRLTQCDPHHPHVHREDLDSTIFAREGSQEGAAKGYNPRRPSRKSHHPLLAVLAEAPFVLRAWLRSGNTASGRGACAFLKEAFAQLPAGWSLRCLRADSGFFDQALLAMLQKHAVPYIIVGAHDHRAQTTHQQRSSGVA